MPVDGEIERCIDTEYRRLVAVVALVAPSFHEAEEAVQEAFARAWERSRRGERFDHLAGWVATVALNQARSGWRRRSSERRARARMEAEPRVEAESTFELRTVVRSAVDGLPRRQRDAVVLYYLLDLDVATTATLLNVSEGTVKTALSRARRSLTVVLERSMEA